MSEFDSQYEEKGGKSMTAITVRSIRPEEWDLFLQAGSSDAKGRQETARYVEQMIAVGSMRPEWCFVAEKENHVQGRVALWTLPKLEKPLDFVLLDVPWEQEDYLCYGKALLQTALEVFQSMGVEKAGHVLDTPPMTPQWQTFPEQRQALLTQMGFLLERETFRFEWRQGDRVDPIRSERADFDLTEPEATDSGLIFRSLAEVGNQVFIDAVKRVSAGTLDSRILQDRDRLGEAGMAMELFQDLQQLVYDPEWWQLAYAGEGQCIGLVMPAKSPAFSTIGYIGVMPEYRGRGYIHKLLSRGTEILRKAGATVIRADTDVNNLPMANAFRKAGYVQFARRAEYSCKISKPLQIGE
ncbi:GNAT family N-acetyltransferase [Brevibacillus ruminantium]|uniref:GNAT family N-acetyltransferase n=1 Tax=Brevibacillus ruminantium TaxID=2950604 RepID=A0ABY4WCU3_9BACL|nr:GNAT family N-acetyltransferase [Brevibacillus ruminantium]USG65000.1 GNAT family N-acetyltransferase [Brevibacillus ruminantium]